jgi:nucleoside-diphosphate-sugar epimerase
MDRLLISGAGGFIGRALCAEAVARGWRVRGAVRTAGGISGIPETVNVGQIDGGTDWTEALHEVDVVIHLAARVHVMNENDDDPLGAFRKVNLEGTLNFARQAARAGVRRFIHVSTIGVLGSSTDGGRIFTEADTPAPHDSYTVSKWETEQQLIDLAAETSMEVVILRPPLVYGAEAPGNVALMLKVLASGFPLPFAAVHNLRSLVYVGNLVDALLLCAKHPAAANRVYLVCDGEDVSTPDLLRRLGIAMGRPARLWSCPPVMLRLAGKMIGRSDQIDRLLGSLRVDSGKLRRELGWVPPFSLQQGLQAAAKGCREAAK